MRADIRDYVSKCVVCKQAKATNVNQIAPMGEYRESERPFQIISCDFMGPYPRSKLGNKYLIVIVDMFSKFIIVRAIRNSGAGKTIEVLKNDVFLKYGVPEILISDNGPQLRSEMFASFLSEFRVKHWLTASYHAQANPTEAANKTILTAIQSYIMDRAKHNTWDAQINEVTFAMNSSPHTTTKYSPHYVVFGQNAIRDGSEYEIFEQMDQEGRYSHIKKIREKVSSHLREAYESSRRRYNLRSNDSIEYGVGETVFCRNMKLSSAPNAYTAKFGPKYIPTVVKEKVGTNTYRLEDVDTGHVGIFHTKMMKR